MSDIETIVHKNADNTISFETKQDASKIIQQNKNDQDTNQNTAFGRRVASVPINVLNEWLHKYKLNIWDFGRCPETTKKIKWLLNSPEYRDLRTHNSRL